MNRTVLIERSDALNYIKESGSREDGKHYLGKLAGIGADFTRPTRNGRRYPLELWQNVEASDDFKEGMSTLTIFGEADHPETRIDTSIKEIAIVLTKFEIKKSEGIVYTEFDILDTPNGRILKELLDYGSQIGVSSRGLGEEIERDGEVIIDPDTYVFYGFDAVVMPAVVTARPSVVESANARMDAFLDSELDKATSVSELESIQRIAESARLPDSMKNKINEKIENFGIDFGGENITPEFEEELSEIATENDKLRKRVRTLEKRISAENIRERNLRNLKRENHTLKSKCRRAEEQIRNLTKQVSYLETEIVDGAEQTNSMDATAKRKIESLERQRNVMKESLKRAVESGERLKRKNNALYEKLESEKYRVSLLEDSSREQEHSMKVAENKRKQQKQQITETKDRLSETNTILKETISEYLTVRCKEFGVDREVVESQLPKNYLIEDINRVVEEVADRKRKLAKVPFAFTEDKIAKVTQIPKETALTSEEQQTISLIESICHYNKKEGK